MTIDYGPNPVVYIGPEGQNILSIDLQVYTRWGELLFDSQTLDNSWDGTFQGQSVPEGTYLYTLNYHYHHWENGVIHFESKNGTFQLLR